MIHLEPVAEPDRGLILDWRNQPDVARWMYTNHSISAAEHDAWFDGMVASPLHHYWILSWRSEPAGVVHLIRDPQEYRAEWGIYVASNRVRGTGAASGAAFLSLERAFGDLGVGRVTCEALSDNSRALALYERVGFRREGYLRGHVTRGTEVRDVVCLGLMEAEWATLRVGLRAGLVDRGVLSPEVGS
ncbi:MAG TPA: UDP-4-amino-4,6-dideoxy-N-acetyl-beta-L-altrosamine N-acetyltransferase [Microthrixaceae bacterium]|mgnify:CR=1 FL=1|nr:UDP-4-amino-4,6-dideoxy-N-acetyl-beta-L-altrosamine N-acetyltransferase [Microthrixaceae bacterium]